MARAEAKTGTRMRQALVTGGAGFVGSHLCERLLSEGYRVLCMDNLRTGSLENLAHLKGEADFEYIDHDLTAYTNVPGELDELYHFASPASPKDFSRIPIPILKVGALGTHNALGLARAKGARFMLASSSEVYGDPLVHPQHEDYWGNVNPIGIRGVYDEAKRYAEAITMAYHRHHKLDTRIVRIFNTYGPRMRPDDGRMIPNFVSQALAGRPLTVYGDGSQTRSVQYVDDLVEGTLRLMESAETRPVNVGNPQEHMVGEIAQMVIELCGGESELVYEPLPEDDPKQRCPDITRARDGLGWEPRVPAREGLKKIRVFEEPPGGPDGRKVHYVRAELRHGGSTTWCRAPSASSRGAASAAVRTVVFASTGGGIYGKRRSFWQVSGRNDTGYEE